MFMKRFFVRSFYTKTLIFFLISVVLLESLLLVFDSPPHDNLPITLAKAPSSPSLPKLPGVHQFESGKKGERDSVDLEFLNSYFNKALQKGGSPKEAEKGAGKEMDKEKKEKENEKEKEREKKEKEEKEKENAKSAEIEAAKQKEKAQETERIAKENLEKERLEKEKAENEKLEKERLEKERIAKEEKERKEKMEKLGLPTIQLPADPFKEKANPIKSILSKSTSPGDSLGFRFMEDPRMYSLCHFEKVCVNSTSYMIIVNNEEERNYYISQLAYCGERSQRRMDLCACFTKQLVPIFVVADAVSKFPKKQGHWWISDKWVFGHQISHWAEKLVNMHSVMQNWESYKLPPLDGIAFLKDALPMSDHEQAIFEISTSPLPKKMETMWLTDFETTGGYCFEQTTMSSLTSTIATSPLDASKFRENAYSYFDIQKQDCPPPKAMLLYRTEPLNRRRMILNMNEVEDLLARYGIKTLDKVTVGGETGSQEQANIFSQYGLILSSHSSQLVNTLFSQPGSSVIEIIPAFFNYDFGEMANQMGLKYLISLGGEVPNIPLPEEAKDCQESFEECHGEGTCFAKLQRTLLQSCLVNGKPYKDFSTTVKHLDFKADLSALEESLKKAVEHLHASCNGQWKGIE